jgi:hypothetical protein
MNIFKFLRGADNLQLTLSCNKITAIENLQPMTGLEKSDLLIQMTTLIEVTAWAGLTDMSLKFIYFYIVFLILGE